MVCAAVRLARARGDEVRQLRWFVLAVAATAAVVAVGLIGWGTPEPGLLAVPLVPVSAGVAILKYRLYDIDPVIATTLVWGAMAAVTLGYAVVVVGVGSLLDGLCGIATVTAELTPEGPRLEVGDDGTGGALARPGPGWRGSRTASTHWPTCTWL